MYIQQLYTNCLAQAAYYVESDGEAAVIDPLRNPAPYIALAKERGASIKYILETHFHADFVSGHLDLANDTGATIVFGPDATPGYKAYVATDGERLHVGKVQIEVVHTPGHTIESACYMVHDEHGRPYAIFTGDTLFAGDVGRPDLLSGNLDKEVLAAMLYDSLQKKIKTLNDDIIVYPGHGAGSACGKNIGKETQTTIGLQKQFNYALRMERAAFIKTVTTDQPAIPGYFFKDAKLNKTGYANYSEVAASGLTGLSPDAFIDKMKGNAVLLDTRDPMTFSAGFIKGALNIGLNGDFAVWAGTFIEPDPGILLVTEPGRETEAVERLARIGYDHVLGYLEDGMQSWFAANKPHERIMTVASEEIKDLVGSGEYELLDVRNRTEVAKDRIPGSVHVPLNQLVDRYKKLGKNNKWLIYCAGGYRSMIAASFLLTKGFHFVASVEGGMNAIRIKHPELVELGQETE